MDAFIESQLRAKEDFAGVFEFDGETGYFYLYEAGRHGPAIKGAIHILSREMNLLATDFTVAWDRQQRHVALLIQNQIWAVFDCEQATSFGGNYRVGQSPDIPVKIILGFED